MATLKKFNLEEALNGVKVVTRWGDKVKNIRYFYDEHLEYPLQGLVNGVWLGFSEKGEYFPGFNSHNDLFLKKTLFELIVEFCKR